jgi:hypothetical protein
MASDSPFEAYEMKKIKAALAAGCKENFLEQLVKSEDIMQDAIITWQEEPEKREWASVSYLAMYYLMTEKFPTVFLERYAPSAVAMAMDAQTVTLTFDLWNKDVTYTLPRDTDKVCAYPEEELYYAFKKVRRSEGEVPPTTAAQGALLLFCIYGKVDGEIRKKLAKKALSTDQKHLGKLIAASLVDKAEELVKKSPSEYSYMYAVYIAAMLDKFDSVEGLYTQYVEPYCPEYMRRLLHREIPPVYGELYAYECKTCRRLGLELVNGFCCKGCEAIVAAEVDAKLK